MPPGVSSPDRRHNDRTWPNLSCHKFRTTCFKRRKLSADWDDCDLVWAPRANVLINEPWQQTRSLHVPVTKHTPGCSIESNHQQTPRTADHAHRKGPMPQRLKHGASAQKSNQEGQQHTVAAWARPGSTCEDLRRSWSRQLYAPSPPHSPPGDTCEGSSGSWVLGSLHWGGRGGGCARALFKPAFFFQP